MPYKAFRKVVILLIELYIYIYIYIFNLVFFSFLQTGKLILKPRPHVQ